jgi:hypothetical protein
MLLERGIARLTSTRLTFSAEPTLARAGMPIAVTAPDTIFVGDRLTADGGATWIDALGPLPGGLRRTDLGAP